MSGELVQDLDSGGVRKRQPQRLLISVDLNDCEKPLQTEKQCGREIGNETHGEKVSTLSRLIHLVPPDMLRIRRTPSSRIVATNRVFNFNDLGTMTIHSQSLVLYLRPSLKMEWRTGPHICAYPRSPRIWVQYGYSE